MAQRPLLFLKETACNSHLSRSGNQYQSRVCFILTYRRASHIKRSVDWNAGKMTVIKAKPGNLNEETAKSHARPGA